MNQATTTATTFAPGAGIIRIVAGPCQEIGERGTVVAANVRAGYCDVCWSDGSTGTTRAAHLAPAPTFAALAKQMPAGEKRLRALSEQVKQHLVSLGCALLPDAEKSPFYDWEVTLPTAAGLLSVSVHISSFALYETDSFIVHGCFPSPELFRRTFCDCNHINPASGKWNVYVTDKSTSNDLADALRYYSRMIPTLGATLAPTNPGPPATLPPFSGDFDLGCRISPTEAYLRPDARTVVFYLDTAVGQFPRTAPHCLLRRLLRLLGVHSTSYAVHWTSARAHRVFCIDETNALALRISEEANQLDSLHGGFTPARAALIARRELGRTAPTNPAPELTPPKPMPTTPKPVGKFPFAVARRNGDRVVLLHQVGKCAVARVYPADKSPAYHLARFRQFYADFEGLDEAGDAFQALRRLDNAERHRDAETLTAADALDQLTVSRACLDQFCELHGLDVAGAYPRRDVRQAVTDLRLPKMAVYLALLKTLNPTNPD